MRFLWLLLTLTAPLPATASCLFFCDEEEVTDLAEAKLKIEGDLGGALPAGMEVTNLLEGGFQDRFILARLESSDPGIPNFLKLLNLTDADFFVDDGIETAGDVMDSAAAGPDWWDWTTTTDLRVAKTRTNTLPYLAVGIASKPGVLDRYVIYLWGFET
jgi:hypothetical protein